MERIRLLVTLAVAFLILIVVICHYVRKHGAFNVLALTCIVLLFGYVEGCFRQNDRRIEELLRAEGQKKIEEFHATFDHAKELERAGLYGEALGKYGKCAEMHIINPDLTSVALRAKARLLATCPDREFAIRHIDDSIRPLVMEISDKLKTTRRCRACNGTGRTAAQLVHCQGCGDLGFMS